MLQIRKPAKKQSGFENVVNYTFFVENKTAVKDSWWSDAVLQNKLHTHTLTVGLNIQLKTCLRKSIQLSRLEIHKATIFHYVDMFSLLAYTQLTYKSSAVGVVLTFHYAEILANDTLYLLSLIHI